MRPDDLHRLREDATHWWAIASDSFCLFEGVAGAGSSTHASFDVQEPGHVDRAWWVKPRRDPPD